VETPVHLTIFIVYSPAPKTKLKLCITIPTVFLLDSKNSSRLNQGHSLGHSTSVVRARNLSADISELCKMDKQEAQLSPRDASQLHIYGPTEG